MARLSTALMLLGLAGSFVSAQQYDQEKQHKEATCVNGCFFEFFTNKCNSDNPACVCTLNDMRKNYFCCVAKKCSTDLMLEAIERSSNDCDAHKIPFKFDPEAACGIKLSTSSEIVSTTAEATTASRVKTSETATTTDADATTGATTGATTRATTSGAEKSAAGETTSASAPAVTENGASRSKVMLGAVVLPIAFGVMA
ncbi:hypothetical protein F53441_9656 [Fusarium austroafricanum]|uniref:Extracellular membrane protein CFEM domain-containing protein n=1 Tax=Fusarium austroafricanum TaxID=2364996 RepID=A0A8H4KC07_9HYPO|nr:hypothetical protein F53441_9656 [Fusarium austroafricanum]